jgi:hypothetical protein
MLFAMMLIPMGIIVTWVGFALWQNPDLNWEVLKHSAPELRDWFATEIKRWESEPIAFVGIVVGIGGVVLASTGIRRLIHRKKKSA